jgi:hypothetical protein
MDFSAGMFSTLPTFTCEFPLQTLERAEKTTKPPLCPRADTILTHTRPAQVTPQSLPCSCEHKEELEVHDEANAKSGNKAWLSRRLHAAIVREQQ